MIACIDQKKKPLEHQIYLLQYVSVPEFWVKLLSQVAEGKRSTFIVLVVQNRSSVPRPRVILAGEGMICNFCAQAFSSVGTILVRAAESLWVAPPARFPGEGGSWTRT